MISSRPRHVAHVPELDRLAFEAPELFVEVKRLAVQTHRLVEVAARLRYVAHVPEVLRLAFKPTELLFYLI
ncbi:MAG: hypothetical protein RLO02_00010, partial [Roseitalea porphyridii]